ncbi:UxaA family hydrolase [Changpingibacter yushuensis]|uniref:UxaA family hydrolase n=1 Tax=Changpingibacter yushuensis TaxID=2758440 RepID=UPI00165EB516|nr:UxaA family hydrolase [Changpingibacter yushuensis]
MKPLYVITNPADNVAITTQPIALGTELMPGVVAREEIPQAHKIALEDIPKGGIVRRYNVVIGYAKEAIAQGSWINEFMLDLPQSPDIEEYTFPGKRDVTLPDPPRTTWLGYDNGPDKFAGTRNVLGIMSSVQCVKGVLAVAVKKMKDELLPKYPNVDDIVPIDHAYGCGVAIDAPDAKIPIRSLKNLMYNPNFGGEIMVVSLGCEKLTAERLLPPEMINRDNVVVLQDYEGFEAIIEALVACAEPKLARLNQRERTPLPLSKLCIGMQCGGSDAFSGLSANPSAGYASDMLVKGGATVMFSEVTEVRDGAYLIADRCEDEETAAKFLAEMAWYDSYLEKGGVDRSANPTPGNKKGGLANIVEKTMGSIAKSGTATITEVISPGELPTKHGLMFNATPASDIVCGPMQVASGITLQVFMTGRGTPYGLDIAPVIKVCSQSDLKKKWFDIIDVNAGQVVDGEKTIPEVGTEIFNLILDVASATKETFSQKYGLKNDFIVFNPAPIT